VPRKRLKHEEHINHERWLITYSDLITLLMIFFVIMYAMSSINQVKFTALQQSLAAALAKSDKIPLNMGKSALLNAGDASDVGNKTKNPASVTQTRHDALDNLYEQLRAYIFQHHLNGNVSILDDRRGVQITLRDVVLFDTGSASLRPDARQLLNGLVPFFNQVPNPIVIEGHTDNQPISTSQYPSNWELSAARAIDVVRYLISQGIQGGRLSGVGYGEFHPIVKNDTPEHRQMNRRVNILIVRENSNSTS
jgi:chemotaxis protein MotB